MCVVQIEESYIGADQFCSLVRQDSQTVLRNELNVLHGLKFDLITHPPLRSLQGLFQACLSMQFVCVHNLVDDTRLSCYRPKLCTCSPAAYVHTSMLDE